ncbi:hypothetical protein P7C70_g3962, partial [Phenoliferia sp. Uapishka_3]
MVPILFSTLPLLGATLHRLEMLGIVTDIELYAHHLTNLASLTIEFSFEDEGNVAGADRLLAALPSPFKTLNIVFFQSRDVDLKGAWIPGAVPDTTSGWKF